MNKTSDLAKKIIVALDVGSKEKALLLVKQLEEARVFKVGLRLFSAEGPSLLQEIKNLGRNVFLDLKLHDIPNTVADAVRVAVRHNAFMLTLHSSGGREMMQRAAEAAAEEAEKKGTTKPLLLAVTILTSLKDEQLREIGMEEDTLNQVLKLAKLAKQAGVDGIVCSPQEIEIVKRELGEDFLVVAPGIRPSWAAAHDQKRILTPLLAIQKGADFLVIGRPIIAAESPQEAYLKIMEELEGAVDTSHGKNSV
ncbi:MAG: orotidine-5'-phosphate decarboxylase [Candidatus Aminicenantes bacterium]|nr:MAG: orotidine-5'-phosphate decarboxylase [Candidatus Aminicenantes bacterium]